MSESRIELLSPAKDLACGIAAINAGADAVYIGAPKFGARVAASNDFQSIRALCDYAHVYYCKVYVTMNTLLHDDELSAAQNQIHRLYECGIDGLIIQDFGILQMDLHDLPVIASTQMNCSTLERIRMVQDAGFSRVILPRELTLENMIDIRKKTTIELECFVHGALCVGVSGQCYLSYACGGRSGNRGQCAQPCRKRYSLHDQGGKVLLRNLHLLSIKDLDLSSYLRELINAGVTSFKIEGRLKPLSYVVNITAFYNDLLNGHQKELGFKRASSGQVLKDFVPDPEKTFNRGYTSYCIHGKPENCSAVFSPKSIGKSSGTVNKVCGRYFVTDSRHDLVAGDGICYFEPGGRLCGTYIERIDQDKVFPAKIKGITAGTEIYRNYDKTFSRAILKSSCERVIPVYLNLYEIEGGLSVQGMDEDGNSAEFEVPVELQSSTSPEKMPEIYSKQLKKMGGTGFICTKVDITLSEPFFIPVAKLNELRRGLIEELLKVREENRVLPKRKESLTKTSCYPVKVDEYDNVTNDFARSFFRNLGAEVAESWVETGADIQGKKLMSTQYCILFETGFCNRMNRPFEKLYLKDGQGNTFQLVFRCENCGMDIYRI